MRTIGIFILALFCIVPTTLASKGLPPGDLPLKINTALFVADVDGIDTSSQSFDIRLFYRLSWLDSREAHPGPEPITKDLDEVWHPQFQIVSQQKIFFHNKDSVTITPEGQVSFLVASWGSYSQAMRLNRFPFDIQDFNFHLVAPGYNSDEIEMIDIEEFSGIASSLSLADWRILDWFAETKAYRPYQNDTINVAGINYGFVAERLSSYYILKMILPLALIVAMSWAVFWMDPLNVASNVGIAITSMLTLIAYRFSADTILPRLPYLTSLDYFILASTILVFASLLQCIATSALAKEGKLELAHRLDIISRITFPALFGIVALETLVFRFFV
ncbi:hypothetical protein [Vibrio breoganii]|uniref:Neurotransmitter-gated ion-channel ligand-binding domain-containing protein n=1 Tax=Vibrio breoganii TaxID=553239 RepID=A0ABX1U9J7_9VIBR|nr:hypothetical protein [Vibrio breoganii]NMO73735.1 hypothetical protein [Vibrio breoganii]NMR70173.1 hypothetical protein [Vibrio breoganii]PMF83173.1 hypothetical protein BCV08_15075 [Vibrio breoganii]PMG04069.1 hypothetical protein BCV02_07055 [Vibrio breoganii]PMG89820.1 hypothetical protein BCU81_07540 [Vibrio breoganii]